MGSCRRGLCRRRSAAIQSRRSTRLLATIEPFGLGTRVRAPAPRSQRAIRRWPAPDGRPVERGSSCHAHGRRPPTRPGAPDRRPVFNGCEMMARSTLDLAPPERAASWPMPRSIAAPAATRDRCSGRTRGSPPLAATRDRCSGCHPGWPRRRRAHGPGAHLSRLAATRLRSRAAWPRSRTSR